MSSMGRLNNEMEEIANTVREYYPDSPHMAFDVFRKSYPDIIAGTVVTLVWSFLEYEGTLANKKLDYTRSLSPDDVRILREPNILN